MTMVKPPVFTSAFASGGDVDTMPLSISSEVPNQITGFPEIFATPYDDDGIPIDRAQTNGVWNAYSKQSVWLQGGGQFIFEPSWVAANGGYDLNTILFDTATQRHVISLHNNNTANFVSTPTLINNTDWAFYPTSLFCTNAAVSGNIPSSTVYVDKSGSYTNAVLTSDWGNESSQVITGMADLGSGFKAYTLMVSTDGTPANNSGIAVVPGERVFSQGDESLLEAFPNSFTLFSDFANDLSGSGYISQPNPGNPDKPIITQFFDASVPVNSVDEVITLPFAFSFGIIAVEATMGASLDTAETFTIGVDYSGGSLTSILATLVTSGTGPLGVHFKVIGY